MFDIGWSELVVIGVVALIVIGPRELPSLLRNIGQVMTKLRRMAADFQGQFQDAIREAELDDLRKQAEKLSGEMTSAMNNPLDKATSELQSLVDAPEKPAVETPASESGESAPAEIASAPVEPAVPEAEPAQGEQSGGGGRAA